MLKAALRDELVDPSVQVVQRKASLWIVQYREGLTPLARALAVGKAGRASPSVPDASFVTLWLALFDQEHQRAHLALRSKGQRRRKPSWPVSQLPLDGQEDASLRFPFMPVSPPLMDCRVLGVRTGCMLCPLSSIR